MTIQLIFKFISVATILILLGSAFVSTALSESPKDSDDNTPTDSDLIFLHHSVGNHWLDNGLRQSLLDKSYITAVNDIYYGSEIAPDANRPDSLQPLPGDYTNMDAWIFWFNDYLSNLKSYQNPNGLIANLVTPLERKVITRFPQLSPVFNQLKGTAGTNGHNRIIMFKSCFDNSHLNPDDNSPGDPFSAHRTPANNQAVFRNEIGMGRPYTHAEETYYALETVFAQNPDTLFIIVTSPPLHFGPADATSDEAGQRAREFNQWLKTEWLAGYQAANLGLNNVAVFDYFDVLAYPADHPSHPNRLNADFGGDSGDSHPNAAADAAATAIFATTPDNFIDQAWAAFTGQASPQPETASTTAP